MQLTDNFGRKINYLRLSVTDRCNMRCVYCMPAGGVEKLAHEEILSYEQFLLIARAAVGLGIEKIRVTGGEPLVRHGIVPFLEQLAKTEGLRQLVLTTNGVKLAGLAQALKDAGVQRLNISLDSLQPALFKQLTRRDLLYEVLAGIEAVEKIGLSYKLNMVVMRGCNDHEICDFAALTREHDCTVRFIEYMPALKEEGWSALVVPGAEILQQLETRYQLQAIDNGPLAGPAREFAIAGGRGRIGVINPLSGHFCAKCNRIRITAAGQVRTCLFSDDEFDLKPLLQLNDVEILTRQLKRLVDGKPACHKLNAAEFSHAAFSMAHIGG
ncbi:MAG: GTP 3',8-cyclase MoaA [Desulfuromonadales bacterium]|nr:GTP 3',8-cyclase MoaA [Desulfuromonadales bacterium]